MSPGTPHQLLALQNELVRTPSNLSLAARLEPVSATNRKDRPNGPAAVMKQNLFNKLKDPYFKKYSDKAVRKATGLLDKHRKFLGEQPNISISPDDKDAIKQWERRIHSLRSNVHSAAERKNKAEAGQIANEIRFSLQELGQKLTSSEINALKFKNIQKVYQIGPGKYNKDGMTLRDNETTLPCDWFARQGIGAAISNWFENPGERRILLLRGEGSCGKSTILHSVAHCCTVKKALAASFRFTSGFTHKDFLQHFFATVVCQVMSYLPSFGNHLSVKYGDLPVDIWKKTFQEQIERALVPTHNDPAVSGEEREKPIIIALDGLETCGTGTLKALITDFIFHCVNLLPVYFIIADASSPAKRNIVNKWFQTDGLMQHVLPVDIAPFASAWDAVTVDWLRGQEGNQDVERRSEAGSADDGTTIRGDDE